MGSQIKKLKKQLQKDSIPLDLIPLHIHKQEIIKASNHGAIRQRQLMLQVLDYKIQTLTKIKGIGPYLQQKIAEHMMEDLD